mgnify:CR=1 FL=1
MDGTAGSDIPLTDLPEVSDAETFESDVSTDEGSSDEGSSDAGDSEDTFDPNPIELPEDFGDPCLFNDDCSTGWCVPTSEGPTGYACTIECLEDCPEGWGCKSVAGVGQDIIFLCAPIFETLCKPCGQNIDCNMAGALCLDMPGGKYCGQLCSDFNPCPDDFDCVDTDLYDPINEETHVIKQCIPQTGSCACGPEMDTSTDVLNCGECGNACTYPNGVAACTDGVCSMVGCEPGFIDLDGLEVTGCEYACEPLTESDAPDPEGVDADCDGVDGELERAIFVSETGYDLSNELGDRENPFQTIGAAIDFATLIPGRDQIMISSGSYKEQISLQSGISLYGGYGPGWVRDPTKYFTRVEWESPDPFGNIIVIKAHELSAPTELQSLIVEADTNATSGGSVIAVHVLNSEDNLRIQSMAITAGSGGSGANGSVGLKGADGNVGQNGVSISDSEELPWLFGDQDMPLGGPGGQHVCGETRVSGGDGGSGGNYTDNIFGGCGDIAGNGSAGCMTPIESNICNTVVGGGGGDTGSSGSDGATGLVGISGLDGAGGGYNNEVDPYGYWHPGDGEAGTNGAPGSGGGGGGGGGGDNTLCSVFSETWGASGGGGGSGGCGGTAGTAGHGGGGSFVVFIVDSSPTILDSLLVASDGGNGGMGGIGGQPGEGRLGGFGGAGHSNTGAGGLGGSGGDGGRGGHGGGGAGGPSFTIFVSGSSSPTCNHNDLNIGAGGVGGLVGNPGTGEVSPEGLTGQDGPSAFINLPVGSCWTD